MLELCGDYSRVILELHWGYIRVILGWLKGQVFEGVRV